MSEMENDLLLASSAEVYHVDDAEICAYPSKHGSWCIGLQQVWNNKHSRTSDIDENGETNEMLDKWRKCTCLLLHADAVR